MTAPTAGIVVHTHLVIVSPPFVHAEADVQLVWQPLAL